MVILMNKKEFFTIHEQIEMLRKKGLTVNNEKIASDILLRENYFFINGYRHPFMDSNKKFFKGICAFSIACSKVILFS